HPLSPPSPPAPMSAEEFNRLRHYNPDPMPEWRKAILHPPPPWLSVLSGPPLSPPHQIHHALPLRILTGIGA
ncbi:MAG TPA: hypothetical protein VG796_14155, partial [Verrucomicrobiales bacterium]|nr:hypothetical protein [Verrucomicrobiales bacterium]